MSRDVNLILNWCSYLIHCLVLTMLILSYLVPYWYVSDKTVDGCEIAGLWVRCKVGGTCRPVHDTLDPMKVNLKPVQALMTVSLILCLVTFALYSVWLWKGEGCATPWKKRCVWCRETYIRSRKPTEEERLKYGRLKWLAFTLATISGVFVLIASIFFMTELMQAEDAKVSNIGWAAWLGLASSVVFIFQHGIISLFFYVLKRPDGGNLPPEDAGRGEETYESEEIDDKELERIQKWILDQRRGVDNPSFEAHESEATASGGRKWRRTRSIRSRASGGGASIFYSSRSASSASWSSASTSSVYRVPRILDPERLRSFSSRRPDKRAQYVPAYSVIFKDKIPMIPREDFSPRSRFVYDVIYHGNKFVKPAHGIDVEGAARTGQSVGEGRSLARSSSDPEINASRPVKGQGRWSPASEPDRGATVAGSLQPAAVPEAYRRRRRRYRTSTSSLPALIPAAEGDYHVRTRYPEFDCSGSGDEVSPDIRGLDLADRSKAFRLEHIWVVPRREHIREAIGRRQVHFKLERSIQELEEIE